METSLPARRDAEKELCWDLSPLCANENELNELIDELNSITEKVCAYCNRLTDAEHILACMELYEEYTRLHRILNAYSEMSLSVDYSDPDLLDLNSRVSTILTGTDAKLSFVDTQLAEVPADILKEAADHETGASQYLLEILRRKPHMLSPETERVLASLSETLSAPYAVYEQAKLADMRFPDFCVDGKQYPLDYSRFEDDYEYDPCTDIRRAAFKAFSGKIREYENVTACAYNTEVRRQKVLSDLRGFDSVFDSLLFEQHVTREMYDRQIDLIMTRLAPHMRRYARLLQKAYGLEKTTFADLKAPVDPGIDYSVSLPHAKADILRALSVLGEDYIASIEPMFTEHRIDFVRNIGKSTGGYCESPYRKGSFILMTWNDRLSDAFTLAHELGHAGHFAACDSVQSIFNTDVSMYFVESPSTMNELIFGHDLLDHTTDPRERRYILSRLVGDTYYHNFVTHLLEAAYQREVYRIIDNGGSVHASTLNRIMGETLRAFWGDTVEIDVDAERTWMRQPHYYMGLYSYTYSAGLTIATDACERIRRDGKPAVEDWKRVLRAGSTLDPAGLAKLAGVDITTDEPLLRTIETIGAMIDEIEELSAQIES